MRILIIKTAAMGDVIRTAYCLPFLVGKYPNAEVTWITSPAALNLLRFNPYIDVLTTDEKSLSGVFDWIISLEEEPVVRPSMLQEHIISGRKFTGCWRASESWEYTEDSREWFDMSCISRFGLLSANKLKKENNLGHAELLGRMLNLKITSPSFWGKNESSTQLQRLNKQKTSFKIGVNLSAGKRWPSKKMPLLEAKKLLRRLLEEWNSHIYILGGESDLPYNSELYASCDSPQVTLLSPSNILSFAAFVKEIDMGICADTLALHLMLSQSIPTVCFFAPTSANEIDGWGITKKVKSLTDDYCSYLPEVNTDTITADRIMRRAISLKEEIKTDSQ